MPKPIMKRFPSLLALSCCALIASAESATPIETFWQECAATKSLPATAVPRIKRFGDTAQLTTQLTALILSGEKTITATSPWFYGDDPAQTPVENGYFVMVGAAGEPLAVLRTTAVLTMPFDAVTEEHSRYEGMAVRPLQMWRQVHRDFFARLLALQGKEWRADMPVTLERFELICPQAPAP